ncbi:MAG: ATP-binding protein [Candidatus Methanofastidiosia archaeon]
MAKQLGINDIRQFDQHHGTRKVQRGDYSTIEGIIRSGTKPKDFYFERAQELYLEQQVERIFLLSPVKYEKDLRKLAERILKDCREKWKISSDNCLIRENEYSFKDSIEILDSDRKEKENIDIIQINLVSILYAIADNYLSRINDHPEDLPPILVRILDGRYPREMLELHSGDIPSYDPRRLLELLVQMTSANALKKYFNFFIKFLTQEDWNMENVLNELETLLGAPTGFNEGIEDLHLVLGIIHKSLLFSSTSEIIQLRGEIEDYFHKVQHSERYIDMLYRKYLQLFPLLAKFQETADFQDKLYFLEESRKIIGDSRSIVEDSFVEPFKRFYLDILKRWMEITIKEGEALVGRAFLEAKLQTKKAIWRENLQVALNIRNVGTGPAADIEISLHDSEDYRILSDDFRKVNVLQRNRDADISFDIEPLKKENITLVLSMSHGESDPVQFSDTLFFVQQEEFIKIRNPFNFTKPAESDMFFNREDLFKWIETNMKGSTVFQNVLIKGQRRTGKTSFLRELHRRIRQDHYSIFVDLELYPDSDDIRFLHDVCEELHRNIPNSIPPPTLQEFVNRRYLVFRDYAENLLENNSKRIILIFDEFDKVAMNIESGLFKPGFLLFLRGFFQHTARVNAVISGNFDFTKSSLPEWKEFFTIFNPKKIGVLDEESAKALITQPVKGILLYDQYAIKKILDFSGKNPFYIQLLCHTLVNYINEKKKKNFAEAGDIDMTVLDKARESAESILGLMWQELSQIEKSILFAISRLKSQLRRSVDLAEIQVCLRQYNIKVKRGRLFNILESLIEKDIITKSLDYPAYYDFNIILFEQWIEEHGRFEG